MRGVTTPAPVFPCEAVAYLERYSGGATLGERQMTMDIFISFFLWYDLVVSPHTRFSHDVDFRPNHLRGW